jgi:hypothetical protein
VAVRDVTGAWQNPHEDFLISIEGHLPGEDKDVVEARLRALSAMTTNIP